MPILARIQLVESSATKNVFLSAIHFATSIGQPCPPFGDELKTSAQEQVEYMLGDGDEEMPLVTADEEVKSEIKKGLVRICSSFEQKLFALLSDTDEDAAEKQMTQPLSDLEWICIILSKMDLMKEFVEQWLELSKGVIEVVEAEKLKSRMWVLKVKVIEVTGKVLDAVGYGNVIIPAEKRVELVKRWLPYIRKMKPLMDSIGQEMEEEVWESMEGAVVALISGLPSNDQGHILGDWWMQKGEEMRYPDLSEAFEVWCYRSKSAKRRLVEA